MNLGNLKMLGWVRMDGDIVWTNGLKIGMPPEGVTVMTTDGENIYDMYYLMSSEYRWINIVDDDEAPLPFEPTHWRFITINEIRDRKIDSLLE